VGRLAISHKKKEDYKTIAQLNGDKFPQTRSHPLHEIAYMPNPSPK